MQAEDKRFQSFLFPLLVLTILTLTLQDRYYLSLRKLKAQAKGFALSKSRWELVLAQTLKHMPLPSTFAAYFSYI